MFGCFGLFQRRRDCENECSNHARRSAIHAARVSERSFYRLAETPKTFSHQIRATFLFSRAERVTLVFFIHSVSSTTAPLNWIFFK